MQHILVIDDDSRLRTLLERFLSENKFLVTSAEDLYRAKEALLEFKFDLLIVDVTLPHSTIAKDGIEFTGVIRKSSPVPIIILTARGELDDRIKGLETGADDYLPKPFEPKELLLRINNILKRSQDSSNLFKFGEFIFDPKKMQLTKNGEFIHITEGEAKILSELCKNMGNAISRDELSSICGGIDDRSIDVQIARLRKKIEQNPKQPIFLHTIRNQGYILHA